MSGSSFLASGSHLINDYFSSPNRKSSTSKIWSAPPSDLPFVTSKDTMQDQNAELPSTSRNMYQQQLQYQTQPPLVHSGSLSPSRNSYAFASQQGPYSTDQGQSSSPPQVTYRTEVYSPTTGPLPRSAEQYRISTVEEVSGDTGAHSPKKAQVGKESKDQDKTNNLPLAQKLRQEEGDEEDDYPIEKNSCARCYISFIVWIFVLLTFPFCFCWYFHIVYEYERAVVFRMGKIKTSKRRSNPRKSQTNGLFFTLPCIEEFRKVDMRPQCLNFQPQEVFTKDSVLVKIDGVIYYRVVNAITCVTQIANPHVSIALLTQSLVRSLASKKLTAQLLGYREILGDEMRSQLEIACKSWGIVVERVAICDITIPAEFQKAMQAEAEELRYAKAKQVAANEERELSKAFKEAAEMTSAVPGAMQLRYLQTLRAIAGENNSTIVFPFPMELLNLQGGGLQSYPQSSSKGPEPLSGSGLGNRFSVSVSTPVEQGHHHGTNTNAVPTYVPRSGSPDKEHEDKLLSQLNNLLHSHPIRFISLTQENQHRNHSRRSSGEEHSPDKSKEHKDDKHGGKHGGHRK